MSTGWRLFLLALVPRLAVWGLGLWHAGADQFIEHDSHGYLRAANDLWGSFVDAGTVVFENGLRRTPVYPLFLAPLLSTVGVAGSAFVQCVVSATLCPLVFRLGALLHDGRAGAVAGLMVALDPISILYAPTLLTETLFTLTATLGLYLLCREVTDRGARGWSGGLALGAATLIRPITLYLPVLLAPALYLWCGSWRHVLTVLLLFLLPVGSWMARNHATTGVATLTTIEGINMLRYRAAGALAYSKGIPYEKARDQLEQDFEATHPKDMNAAQRSKAMTAMGARILIAHPVATVVTSLQGCARMLLGPGQEPLDRYLAQPLFGGGGLIGLTAISLVWLGCLYAAFAMGLWRILRDGDWRAWLPPLALLLYLVMISSGFEAYSRFRVPLTPLLALVAGVGLDYILSRLTARRRA